MPEARELMLMSFMLAYLLLLRLGLSFGSGGMQLLNIWVDPTVKEVEAEGELDVDETTLSVDALERRRRILNHQAYVLPAHSDLTRGSSAKSGRSLVWPTGLSDLASLVLQGVSYTARSIVLNFGSKILAVRLINHTSVQVYRRNTWEQSVRDIPAIKDARQFKIAIALEFPSFVIAFVSADLICEPHWYSSMEEMKKRDPPPTLPFPHEIPTTKEAMEAALPVDFTGQLPLSLAFEDALAKWIIQRRRRSKRTDLAILVIRKHEKTFPGAGVYTVCELFYIAGLSPYLTEAEVFDCPSRTARLVEAYYAFLHDAWKIFEDFMQAALHDTILAPSPEHRFRCGQSCFHVFAKKTAMVTKRMKKLQVLYKDDVEAGCPIRYDVFEPRFMSVAFRKDIHLGEMIFGPDLFPLTGITPSAVTHGPLQAMFMDADLIDAPTHLCHDEYLPAFPTGESGKGGRMNHYAFRIETEPSKRPITGKGKSRARSVELSSESECEVGIEPLELRAVAPLAVDSESLAVPTSTTTSNVVELPAAVLAAAVKVRYVRGVIWTCVPPRKDDLKLRKLRMLTQKEMWEASFQYVVNKTKQVVVGPLEWFGNGVFIKDGKRVFIGACHADPVAFPLNGKKDLVARVIRGRERARFLAQNPGSAKRAAPAALTSKVRQGLTAYTKARNLVSSLTSDVQPSSAALVQPPSSSSQVQRRRRIHADARLVSEASHFTTASTSAIVDSPTPTPSAPLPPARTTAQQADPASDEDTDEPLFHLHFAIPDHIVYASTGRTLDFGDGDASDSGSENWELEEEDGASASGLELHAASGSEYEASSSPSHSDESDAYSDVLSDSSEVLLHHVKRVRRLR